MVSGSRRAAAGLVWFWSLTGISLFSAGVTTSVAHWAARLATVPQRLISYNSRVLRVSPDKEWVWLREDDTSVAPGRYSLLQQGGAAHWRLGDPAYTPIRGAVVRPVLGRDTTADVEPGEARITASFFHPEPRAALGYDVTEVTVDSPVGSMPAWSVPAPAGDGTTWAVLVHGHGGNRTETMRAMPVLRRLGIHCLAVTYRNDVGAAPSTDHQYHLGSSEWEDIDAAVAYAVEHGAERVVLVGWSMGGGIALRQSVVGEHRDRVVGLVLDGPAVDWADILAYQAKLYNAPWLVRDAMQWLMHSPVGSRLLQLSEPIDLAEMSVEFYAEHLDTPTLLLHSLDDKYVPPGPGLELARARPDLITFVAFRIAAHVREWNVNPAAWEAEVAAWLRRLLKET